MPPRRDREVALALPPITSAEDVAMAHRVVLAVVAEGRITPSEAITLTGLIEVGCRALAAAPPPQPHGETPGVIRIAPDPLDQ
jgi:hypothetical protein